MAKNRMTLTLESDEDAAVRAAAQEEGLELSAFLRVAALAEVSRLRRTKARFAEIDALSRAAEQAPAEGRPAEQTEPSAADDAAMDSYLDAIDTAFAKRRPGTAA
ncbi:hypothetical protein [Streptomyces sp. NBC_01190]|uniref:hypothetical protein n=1 Tax=Streptomyces sp. NBC_01190 TaxID=2903767 RepID=UPI003869C373|nr:hypothetical protein OG519_22110 [Streptomyces sp. NBC_01190]